MLILKVFANENQIDEIQIQNCGFVGGKCKDRCYYFIRLPEGHDDRPILHKRSDGWMPLAVKAIKEILKHDKKN